MAPSYSSPNFSLNICAMYRGIITIGFSLLVQFALAQVNFQDITLSAGIADPGNKNHSLAFGDFDNDGDQDIYTLTRLNENKLFENLGNGVFNNVAPLAGLNLEGSARAAVWGDINNDGWLDLYVGMYQSPDRLFINNGPTNNGDFTFTDITFVAGIFNSEETISVHLADIDNDGLLDIYVANYMAENRLYRNNGNLTFADITQVSGTTDDSFSMGCAFFDYDNDGDQDLYLVHDFEQANILYENDGVGQFTNVAEARGVAVIGHGMGVDVADVNRDGWWDLYITDLDENVLLLNDGAGNYVDISDEAGIEDTGMGWSTFFLDFDNDGWQDIYVVNDSQFSPEPNVLYRNNRDNTFTLVDQTDAASTGGSVGGACADINNDGYLDIAIANTFGAEGNQLFQNTGGSHHWIGFHLEGTRTNRSAIGSVVEIEYGDGLVQRDVVMAGTGFGSANTLYVHFGLAGYETVSKATVYWASGQIEEFTDLEVDQTQTLSEQNLPQILTSIVTDSLVEQYDKFETTLAIDATYDNPYDYDQVQVSAAFISPTGSQYLVDGFYMQDYDLNTANGSLTPVGDGEFRIRFAPNELGTWSFQASVTDSVGTVSFDEQTFECVPITEEENNGFVRIGGTNYHEFDNGEQLVLIGENMAWQNSNAFTNYRNWLTQLDDNGGNFIRLWHAHWGLGIEWKNNWQNFEGLRRYKEANCFYQDWLYDFCADRGIYVMLALQHHGPVSSQVNPNWNDSPYNMANGGSCSQTWEFFTNEEARAHTRNRYRYIVARWGYSRAIHSWELFNEVNWTDNYETHTQKVRDWHTEMGAYLKTIDPYNHLVTTSYAHSDQDPEVWNNPDFDLTQTHFYINTPNIERALAGGVRQYLEEFDKPTLTGEFGLGGSPNLSNADPDGIHLHNGLWGALFGGGAGTGMTWWWDVYVHPRNLYYHFFPIRTLVDDVPFVDANLSPTVSYVSGAPGDLALTPSLGWGVIGDEDITINATGTTTPTNPGLGQYLYGSQWNTEYRSPPSFSVNYPEEGTFTVYTSTATGTNPRISIYVNGSLLLNDPASTNSSYSVLVPPGANQITVDNLGTDWISISRYEFAGVGSKVDAYTLLSEDKETAAGWLFNHAYNHVEVLENGEPEVVNAAELVIDEFASGNYFVKWYDCLTGEIVMAEPVSSNEDGLRVLIPSLFWDLAYRIDTEEVVGLREVIAAEQVNVFPNPAIAGANISIALIDERGLNDAEINIYDSSGRHIASRQLMDNQLQLPVGIPAGFYWLRLRTPEQVGTTGIVIE